MNRQQMDQQIDFVRQELTRISQEILYVEGMPLQHMRVRQARLAAELERLEGLRRSEPSALPVRRISSLGHHM